MWKNINCIFQIPEDHPAYKWARKQSDSVGAFGHIGTHLDCYTKMPFESCYSLDVVVISGLNGMPPLSEFEHLRLNGKALFLHTGALEQYGYGTEGYDKFDQFLSPEPLDTILARKPQFLLIDSCGIGHHGEEHILFDKRCEEMGCFVIENIFVNTDSAEKIHTLRSSIDLAAESTGKPCEIYARFPPENR